MKEITDEQLLESAFNEMEFWDDPGDGWECFLYSLRANKIDVNRGMNIWYQALEQV